MNIFGEISKVEEQDDGSIKVFGVASSGARDEAGEVVTPAAMKAALPGYAEYPALREMHGLSAAGRTIEAEVDEGGVTRIVAHVVDPVAIAKVKTKTYAGFSIGGKVLARDPNDRSIITKLKLNEISLVDRPCNPEASIDLWKADIAQPEGHEMTYAPTNDEVKALAETMAKAAGKTGKTNDFLAKAREKLIADHVEPEPAPAAEEPAPITKAEEAEAASADTAETSDADVEAPAAEAAEAKVAPEGEPAAEKADLADALTAAVEKAAAVAAPPEDAVGAASPAQVTPGLAEFGKGLAKLGEIYAADPLAKGLYTVASLARLIDQLAGIQASAAWESEYEGDNSALPQELADSVQALGASLVAMAREEVAELVAAMTAAGGDVVIEIVEDDDAFAYAASVVDLVKADADLMAAAAERLPKAPEAPEEARKAEAADDIAKLQTEKGVLEEAIQKALPAIEALTKGLEDARAEIDVLKAQPMPSRAAASVHAVSKTEDASPGTAPVRLSEDQLAAELAKMSEHDRAMLLTKAALRLPIGA